MRINKLVAQATGLSRRAADQAVLAGRVTINGRRAAVGGHAAAEDEVRLDGHPLASAPIVTIKLHKPPGYVCSRRGQGSRTIYDLLPAEYRTLKPVGRLDKDSSGLLLLTNDGDLANRLTHPRYAKDKVYEVELGAPLAAEHRQQLKQGVQLPDGASHLNAAPFDKAGRRWRITMREGRNRQIRRTFAALGYRVISLHRTHFGPFSLERLRSGEYRLGLE